MPEVPPDRRRFSPDASIFSSQLLVLFAVASGMLAGVWRMALGIVERFRRDQGGPSLVLSAVCWSAVDALSSNALLGLQLKISVWTDPVVITSALVWPTSPAKIHGVKPFYSQSQTLKRALINMASRKSQLFSVKSAELKFVQTCSPIANLRPP